MKKFGSILIIAAMSTVFACKNGNKEYKDSDTSMMMAPDTSMKHNDNMNTMPADTSMHMDTAMKK